jgi:hypothetical protein
VFGGKLFEQMKGLLFDSSPNENGCFLLTKHYATKSGVNVIMVVDVLAPKTDSWNYSSEHSLGPSSSFINHASVVADTHHSGLMFVHTHPGLFHPPHFSSIDQKSNSKLFGNLSEILPDRPLGSLVLSGSGLNGVVFSDGRIHHISDFRIVGLVISEFIADGKPKRRQVDEAHDRQVRAIGEARQKRLQELTIAVVGAGGVGSSVAVQLARMGVKRLLLVDRDDVEETNLSRTYGSTKRDVGKAKVEVVKKHIGTFSRTHVVALNADVSKFDIFTELVESDIILGCTDNLTSRAVLNDISLQYNVPLIDIGTRIHLSREGSIDQAVVKVQVVTPDSACLWCTGTLDGKAILQESFSDQEKEKLAEEGYYEDIQKQPSVISMTTLAASVGVDKLLSLLGVFGTNYATRTQLELRDDFMLSDSPPIRDTCVCKERRGQGNTRQISH